MLGTLLIATCLFVLTPHNRTKCSQKLHDGMDGDLPRIVGGISYAAKSAIGADSWNQSIHSIVHKAHGAGVRARLAVKLGVVQHIRGLECKHQVEPFVDGEAPSDTGVDIGSPGQPKISLGLGLVPDPVEIRDDTSVSAGQRFTLESTEIVL